MQKITFWVVFIIGILIIIIGLYLKSINVMIEDSYMGEYGDIHSGSVNGDGALIIGLIMLGLSSYQYKVYLDDKKEREKLNE